MPTSVGPELLEGPSFLDRNLTVLATTSILLFFWPSYSHLLSRRRPSTRTLLPLLRYWPQDSACLPKTTASMKRVSSFHSSPDLNLELTAMWTVATGVPPGVYLTSGSLVRLPMRMTRLNIRRPL